MKRPPITGQSAATSAKSQPDPLTPLERRQATIRRVTARVAELPAEQAAVALCAFAMMPNGSLQTTVIGVEPEQCEVFAQALEAMAARMREHQRQHSRADRAAEVLNFTPKR